MSNSLLRRARESGKCPPSLLLTEPEKDGLFEVAVTKVIDSKSFALRSDPQVALDFLSVMEKASDISKVTLPSELVSKQKALVYRRCVVIALVGSTNPVAPSVESVLSSGYLTSLNGWLADILSSRSGSVDLLLHMLSNVVSLPVSKSIVKESGMGKAIGALDKHPICKGTANEGAIKSRVKEIKEAWQASVKSRKQKEELQQKVPKRVADKPALSPTSTKRMRTEGSKDSLSTLLGKVSSRQTGANKFNGMLTKGKIADKKKTGKRVKWRDHFGGEIAVKKIIMLEGEEEAPPVEQEKKPGSWSDRKKRDRIRERELLAKAKRAKLMDDDDDTYVPATMKATVPWKYPSLLPERAEITKPVLDSPEVTVQQTRMKSIAMAVYLSETDVPSNPAPLTDVEQALDMNSQAAATVATIPFFAPQEQASLPTESNSYNDPGVLAVAPVADLLPPSPDSAATPEFVQSLGLPIYLAGHPVKTLQTLASSPSLLNTLVGVDGLYDQSKLMTLVHTINASNAAPVRSTYQPPSSVYAAPSSMSYNTGAGSSNGYHVKKSDEGNLHVAGYGPATSEAELIAAFSPYVKVDEVVMKSNFSFVNTSDPMNALRAKEALTGTLVGGMPIRINAATRKSTTPGNNLSAYTSSSGSLPQYKPPSVAAHPPTMLAGAQSSSLPIASVDSVRDDRGNPATKNLFVAGYGPNTPESELRNLFSQYATVTGVVSKGTFSFVNTLAREEAVKARQFLGGTLLNGGVLRINFAKETGRLGTSFDLTYNTNTGPNSGRNPQSAPVASGSYYGRGY